MSEPYPDVVARFYDAVYAQVRDGVDNDYYLSQMAEAGGRSSRSASAPAVSSRQPWPGESTPTGST